MLTKLEYCQQISGLIAAPVEQLKKLNLIELKTLLREIRKENYIGVSTWTKGMIEVTIIGEDESRFRCMSELSKYWLKKELVRLDNVGRRAFA